MSYLDGLPAYVYELPCGHSFRSLTRSVADDPGDGMHWFWCQQCRTYAALRPSEVMQAETPPLHPSGMRMSDNQLTVRINAAIVKDRVAAHYRVFWDSLSVREVAERLKANRDHVSAVALDLGVYR
jgi:hypothetical protein